MKLGGASEEGPAHLEMDRTHSSRPSSRSARALRRPSVATARSRDAELECRSSCCATRCLRARMSTLGIRARIGIANRNGKATQTRHVCAVSRTGNDESASRLEHAVAFGKDRQSVGRWCDAQCERHRYGIRRDRPSGNTDRSRRTPPLAMRDVRARKHTLCEGERSECS